MAGHFIGNETIRQYDQPGSIANPCFAACLAMLGVGPIGENQNSLIEQGIAGPDGSVSLDDDGQTIVMGKQSVIIDEASALEPDQVLPEFLKQLIRKKVGRASLIMVKLDTDKTYDQDDRMHFELLGGLFRPTRKRWNIKDKTGLKTTDVLLGDSRRDGVQRVPSEQLERHLALAVNPFGTIMSWPVRVEPAARS